MLGVRLLTKIACGLRWSLKGIDAVFGQLWLISFLAGVKDDDEEDMSGQAMVGQAGPGTLASGDGIDITDSQVVLGVANVHVDAVLL